MPCGEAFRQRRAGRLVSCARLCCSRNHVSTLLGPTRSRASDDCLTEHGKIHGDRICVGSCVIEWPGFRLASPSPTPAPLVVQAQVSLACRPRSAQYDAECLMLRGLDHVLGVHCKREMFSGGLEEVDIDDGPGSWQAPRILKTMSPNSYQRASSCRPHRDPCVGDPDERECTRTPVRQV